MLEILCQCIQTAWDLCNEIWALGCYRGECCDRYQHLPNQLVVSGCTCYHSRIFLARWHKCLCLAPFWWSLNSSQLPLTTLPGCISTCSVLTIFPFIWPGCYVSTRQSLYSLRTQFRSYATMVNTVGMAPEAWSGQLMIAEVPRGARLAVLHVGSSGSLLESDLNRKKVPPRSGSWGQSGTGSPAQRLTPQHTN